MCKPPVLTGNRVLITYSNKFLLYTSLRVLDEHFSEEKGFILRDIENKINSTRIRIRFMGYGARSQPLSYLTCWWIIIKLYQIPISLFTFQSSVRACSQMTNSSRMDIRYHRHPFDKGVKRMLPQEGNLSILKIFFVRKWVETLGLHVLLFKINKKITAAWCINK